MHTHACRYTSNMCTGSSKTHMHTCTHIHKHACTCTCTHTHTSTYTRTHTYTHAYKAYLFYFHQRLRLLARCCRRVAQQVGGISPIAVPAPHSIAVMMTCGAHKNKLWIMDLRRKPVGSTVGTLAWSTCEGILEDGTGVRSPLASLMGRSGPPFHSPSTAATQEYSERQHTFDRTRKTCPG
jgi:hypothetical protein